MITSLLKPVVRRIPGAQRAFLTARFGDTGRTEPLTNWGSQRGQPVDRWYIERYLGDHSSDVSGRVLEVKSDLYASRFGASAVDVVDIDPSNPYATVMGDLCDPATLEPSRYDAAIVTQTLQLVRDPQAALRNLLGSLRRRGALLVTVPCLSRIVGDIDRWRWTPAGFEQLIAAAAPLPLRLRCRALEMDLRPAPSCSASLPMISSLTRYQYTMVTTHCWWARAYGYKVERHISGTSGAAVSKVW